MSSIFVPVRNNTENPTNSCNFKSPSMATLSACVCSVPVVSCLRDGDLDVQQDGLDELCGLDSEEGRDCCRMAVLSDPAATAAIVRLLTAANDEVRSKAANALGCLCSSRTMAAEPVSALFDLSEACDDDDEPEDEASAPGAVATHVPATPSSTAVASSVSADQVTRVLFQRHGVSLLTDLIALLHLPHPYRQADSLFALQWLLLVPVCVYVCVTIAKCVFVDSIARVCERERWCMPVSGGSHALARSRFRGPRRGLVTSPNPCPHP